MARKWMHCVVLTLLGAALCAEPAPGQREPQPRKIQYKRYKRPSKKERREMVRKAVQFLVNSQHENGSFGYGKEVGVTAVVLHALLLSDPSFRSPDNKVTQKAVAFLLNNVQPDGRISDPKGGYDNYKTSISVVALSAVSAGEYDAIVKAATKAGLIPKEKVSDLAREKLFSAAEQWIVKQQASEANGFERDKDIGYGGQGYGGVPVPDLSNSQFALDALYAMGARRLHPFFKRMEVFLNRTQNLRAVNDLTDKAKFPELRNFEVMDDGGFGYSPAYSKADQKINARGKKFSRSYASMTAAGLKSLLQLGLPPRDIRVKRAMQWLANHYTLEFNAGLDDPAKPEKGLQGLFYYYWTYARAMALSGKKNVKLPDGTVINWAAQLAGKLKSLQKENGAWVNEHSRWHEADPCLVTGYALVALHFCNKMLAD